MPGRLMVGRFALNEVIGVQIPAGQQNMIYQKLHITNIFGEKLDLLLQGNEESNQILIFVHGFGTDKDEGFASFLDCAEFLQDDFLEIRFDLSGYGDSEGEEEEFQFQKAAGDVDSVIRFARKMYPNKEINIVAHSLGTFIIGLLSPYFIRKIIFTSVPNSNINFVSEQIEKRIISKGGTVNKKGVTIYPRTKGKVQKVGKDYWSTLETFQPLEFFEELGAKTDLIIYKPLQDEVLENKYYEEYASLKNLQYVKVDGDHNFKKPADRKHLFNLIKEFLMK